MMKTAERVMLTTYELMPMNPISMGISGHFRRSARAAKVNASSMGRHWLSICTRTRSIGVP